MIDNLHEEQFKSAAPSKIRVRNLQRAVRVNTVDLEKFATKAVRMCLQLRKNGATRLAKVHEVFVWLISDRRMALLHRKFRHQPGPTDVLTFQHGEIFVSVETARRNARIYRNSLAHELRLYVVHGLLHLYGFEDRTEAEARKMERMQERILRSLT